MPTAKLIPPRPTIGPGGIGTKGISPEAIRSSTPAEKLWDYTEPLRRVLETIKDYTIGATPEEENINALISTMHPLGIPVQAGKTLGYHGTKAIFDFFKNRMTGHPSQPHHQLINLSAVPPLGKKATISTSTAEDAEFAAKYAASVASERRYGPSRPAGVENVRVIPIKTDEPINLLDYSSELMPDAITPEEADMIQEYITKKMGNPQQAANFRKNYDELRRRIAVNATGANLGYGTKSYSSLAYDVPETIYEEHPKIKGFIYDDSSRAPAELGGEFMTSPVVAITEKASLSTPWGVPLTEAATNAERHGFLPGFSPSTTYLAEQTAQESDRFAPKYPIWSDVDKQPNLPEFPQGYQVTGVGGTPKYSPNELVWLGMHDRGVDLDNFTTPNPLTSPSAPISMTNPEKQELLEQTLNYTKVSIPELKRVLAHDPTILDAIDPGDFEKFTVDEFVEWAEQVIRNNPVPLDRPTPDEVLVDNFLELTKPAKKKQVSSRGKTSDALADYLVNRNKK